MQININTDNHIENSDRREVYFTDLLKEKLKRFEDNITALEIHVTDENSKDRTKIADIKCVMEARANGMKPMAVSCHADTVEKAIAGATDKLKHLLEHTFDKLKSH
ncbi:MAG: HPF/RaiA family ribosome-associated protein [Bacteroidota bacterium]